MCGIAGFSNYNMNYREDPGPWYGILQSMNHTLHHRGPDEEDVFLSRHVGLSHTRLSILVPGQGKQHMTRQMGDHLATIVLCQLGPRAGLPLAGQRPHGR